MIKPIFKEIYRHAIIPVVEIERIELAEALAPTLVEAGLPLLEITLRTPAALSAIQHVREAYPNLILGAGTILTLEQAK